MASTVKAKPYKVTQNTVRVSWALIFLGVLGLTLGFFWKPEVTWGNFLINGYYFLTLSLAGLFFVAIQYVANGRWSEVLRRIPEAMSSYLPWGGLLLIPIFIGAHSLYHWTHAEAVATDAVLQGKSGYLNIAFFAVRFVVIIGLWTLFAKIIRSNSLKQDTSGDIGYFHKNLKSSIIFLFVFAFSLSFFSYDLIMSLEPHWFSTMFAVYNFAGLFVNGVVVIALLCLYLKDSGHFPEFSTDHLHDLGKFIFAFSVFWAYIWFSQFMLIWYANIPEETIYFYNRFVGGFKGLFFINLFVNFVVPFFVLMTRNAKRNPNVIKGICIWLLIGRWIDIYLMVMPGVYENLHHSGHGHAHPSIGVIELLVPFGFAGVFILVVTKALAKAPLLPQNSPILEESLHHHQ